MGNLHFTLSNVALMRNKSMRSLKCQHVPNVLSGRVPRCTAGALVGKAEHDHENSKDEGKDKEQGHKRDGSIVKMGGMFRRMSWTPLKKSLTCTSGHDTPH
jgi:hypothetical protein